MKICHIAIWTKDLDAMKYFYVNYFEGISNTKYVNSQKKFESFFISFENGTKLELMHRRDITECERNKEHIGIAHLAFSTGSQENVISLTETLRKDGFEIISNPRTTGDGYFESTISDPEGNLIELTV